MRLAANRLLDLLVVAFDVPSELPIDWVAGGGVLRRCRNSVSITSPAADVPLRSEGVERVVGPCFKLGGLLALPQMMGF